ncbi:hypothetical protein ACFCYB_40950 [Streptomyces sp. NPDC056309]|uniref:hypothetical protein n=1 Tax=unclassified Streptomyces TaxID=2593676 RepID=UPI0035DC684D
MPQRITLADDSDLAHLVDLLDMLREPGVAPFWDEGGHHTIGQKFAAKLRPILTGQGGAREVDYLAVYVLKYLGKGNMHVPEEQITKWLRGVGGLPAAGHAWVEDATRTAWTLVNRYSLPNWRGYRDTPGQAWLSTP